MFNRKVKFGTADILILAGLAGLGLYLAHRAGSELNYRWDWAALPQYFLRRDPETGAWAAGMILKGLLTTLRLSLGATVLATLLGVAAGLLKTGRSLFHRLLGQTYVELVRNLPPLVLVFIFYYFVSDQIMPLLGVEEFVRSRSAGTQEILTLLLAPPQLFTSFLSALITLSIYEGAYITEIVRAGIESVEKGQWEASAALGLTRLQQLRYVIGPQAVRRTLPPLAGQFISTIKDSAIVSVISIQELTFQGLELMSATYLTMEVWLTVGFLYLVLCLGCSLAVGRLDKRMNRDRR